jgi:hypothetical protein
MELLGISKKCLIDLHFGWKLAGSRENMPSDSQLHLRWRKEKGDQIE